MPFCSPSISVSSDYLEEGHGATSVPNRSHLAAEQEALELLDTIPGVGQRAAEILLAEMGRISRGFPAPKHLASWAGMCPGNQEAGASAQWQDPEREYLASAGAV